MKKIVIILVLALSGLNLFGQSDAILSQQWFSRMNFNPAATGNTNDLNIFLQHRIQWAGFDDAPSTTLLNAMNYFDKINSGVGLSLSYDKEGALYTNLNAKLAYAYQIKFNDKMLLSLGLGLNLLHRSIDYTKAEFTTPEDWPTTKENKTGVDFDFGFEFNLPRVTLGASINHLGRSDATKLTNFKTGQEIYAYGRYLIPIVESIDVAPTVAYVHANHKDLFEAGLTGFIAKKFWVGASYRWDVALSFMAGFEFNIFRVGYAYDHYLGDVSYLASSSHEIMLSVRIPHKK